MITYRIDMMTSSNGNIFRVTGHLCGEFTGPRCFMFSLICAWINRWVNNREAGDLRRYRAHYDVIEMDHTSDSHWRPPRMISPSCWFRRCLWWLWENLSCCKRTVLCLCHEHIYRVRLKNTCTYSWVIYNPIKMDFIMIIVDGVLWEFVSLKVTISMNELYIIT